MGLFIIRIKEKMEGYPNDPSKKNPEENRPNILQTGREVHKERPKNVLLKETG